MADDIEASLIDGGISPAAAKILSNAINNAATGRLTTSRQLEDATDARRLRQIERNDRKYLYTNIDQPGDPVYRREINEHLGRFADSRYRHTYENSQPASANPTLSSPTTVGGKFVQATPKTSGDVAQSEVTLNTSVRGGTHARMNKATGKIESVPFEVEFEPKGMLEGEFVEEDGRTLLKIRIVCPTLRGLFNFDLRGVYEIGSGGIWMGGAASMQQPRNDIYVLCHRQWDANRAGGSAPGSVAGEYYYNESENPLTDPPTH